MKTYDAYLCGYYGMKNSGDDALMYAAAWGAETFLNVQKMIISSPRKMQIADKGVYPGSLHEAQRFRGQNRLQHYYAALRSKRVIFGGGSVLHNATDIRLKIDMMRLAGNHGSVAIGVGLGPFANTDAEVVCAEFLKRCDYVGVRDKVSYECAKSIAPNANVQLTFDLAPTLLCGSLFQVKPVARSGVAFNLCPIKDFNCNSIDSMRRVAGIAEVIERLWEETGEPIYLVDINGHSEYGDSQIHQLLKSMLSPRVEAYLIEYDPNPLRLIQRLASYKAVVSMRLHGAILGYLAQTPVISLNYHSKCVGWCDQIKMPYHLRFDATNICVDSLSYVLIDGLDQGFSQPQLSCAQAVKSSLNNWSFSHASLFNSHFGCHSIV